MEIKIGADELILWLRKNGKAQDNENITLGRKIADLIKKLGGEFEERNEHALWSLSFPSNGLTKTSQQYTIDVDKLPDLFKELSTW